MKASSVSIIIPVLNEADYLGKTLDNVRTLSPQAFEVTLVDGGSTDESVKIASQYDFVKVLHAQKAIRSYQMHLGAERSTGEILCFLHADTELPSDAVSIMRNVMSKPSMAMAGFTSVMRGPKGIQYFTTFHNFIKTYYAALLFRPYKFFFKGARLLFGDQVIFCKRDKYFVCGGFDPEMPIMEEADLCDRICLYGRIRQLRIPVYSSDRRVAKWGALKANLIFLYIGFMWGVGYPPKKLKRFFEDVR